MTNPCHPPPFREGGDRNVRVTMNMIHSMDELEHALSHLIPSESHLQGHECLCLYRNVRGKYVDYPVKEGPKQIESFRSIESGILAAHKAGICFETERPASAMYIGVNPQNVPAALKETNELYSKWLEYNAGLSKNEVRHGNREDFPARLQDKFEGRLMACKSRDIFSMIDVDDPDPSTWLRRIREAIGEEAIEMVIRTKNGYHVVFQRKKMTKQSHKALGDVLSSDKGKGPEASVTLMKGPVISCALPGAFQADHKTSIISCSCKR